MFTANMKVIHPKFGLGIISGKLENEPLHDMNEWIPGKNTWFVHFYKDAELTKENDGRVCHLVVESSLNKLN